MKIYLGGGLINEEDIEYYKRVKKLLKSAGHKVKYPLPYFNKQTFELASSFTEVTNSAKEAIKWADIIYIDFDAYEHVAAGSISEVAWANYLGKFIVISITGKNPNYGMFLEDISDLIFKNHNDAMLYLCSIKE